MNQRIILHFPTIAIPDGEGFNALPIAF